MKIEFQILENKHTRYLIYHVPYIAELVTYLESLRVSSYRVHIIYDSSITYDFSFK